MTVASTKLEQMAAAHERHVLVNGGDVLRISSGRVSLSPAERKKANAENVRKTKLTKVVRQAELAGVIHPWIRSRLNIVIFIVVGQQRFEKECWRMDMRPCQ